MNSKHLPRTGQSSLRRALFLTTLVLVLSLFGAAGALAWTPAQVSGAVPDVATVLSGRLPELGDLRLPGMNPDSPAAPDSPQKLNGIITVNQLNQDVSTDGLCSLPEAIYAANFDANVAIDPNNLGGPKITTG